MGDLIVLGFDGIGIADEVLTKLRSLKKENLIDLEDACVAVHTEAGAVQVKQAVKTLDKTIPKGSAALFVLVKKSTPDKVLPEIEAFKPRVIKTSLSKIQEEKLRTALSVTANAA